MAVGKSPFHSYLENIPAPLYNRYLIVLVVFSVWVLFFDKHDIVTQWKLNRTVEKLEADQAYYARKIREAENDRYDLDVNREKYAREQYYLKKDNEDVFIIVDESELERTDYE